MEALSGVASGMAVASLSIQLIESIGKIKTFIRNVKDAPKELERLVELLERLGALLEDVRNLMERQSSLQGQHFPAPSMTIFKCLHSCEMTLQPLHSIVEKFDTSQPPADSIIAKLKKEVKLGLKTKDIAAFEMRVDQEINYLHAALGMNSTTILVNVLPALLHVQETRAAISLQPPQSFISAQGSPMVASECNELSVSTSTGLDISRRTFRVESSFEMLGLYRRKTIHAIRHGRGETKQQWKDQIEVIYEVNRYTWANKHLRFGLQWDQQYGSILPSLNVYPVVNRFGNEVYELFGSGSIVDIQQLFSSGALHPYTRDQYGDSLLHRAVISSRADICQLLLDYGLRPDLTNNSWSVLDIAVLFQLYSSPADQIDIFRLCLHSLNPTDDIRPYHLWGGQVTSLYLEALEWLWINSSTFFPDAVLIQIRLSLIKILVQNYDPNPEAEESITCLIVALIKIDNSYIESMTSDDMLFWLFYSQNNPIESYRIGNAFIALLSQLGLDIQTYMAKVPKYLGTDEIHFTDDQSRKTIVFEPREDQGWILGWEWFYDHQGAGYLVVSEYSIIASQSDWEPTWPYSEEADDFFWKEHRQLPVHTARFNRRMVTKARKERARTGQKIPKSRMPGGWSW